MPIYNDTCGRAYTLKELARLWRVPVRQVLAWTSEHQNSFLRCKTSRGWSRHHATFVPEAIVLHVYEEQWLQQAVILPLDSLEFRALLEVLWRYTEAYQTMSQSEQYRWTDYTFQMIGCISVTVFDNLMAIAKNWMPADKDGRTTTVAELVAERERFVTPSRTRGKSRDAIKDYAVTFVKTYGKLRSSQYGIWELQDWYDPRDMNYHRLW